LNGNLGPQTSNLKQFSYLHSPDKPVTRPKMNLRLLAITGILISAACLQLSCTKSKSADDTAASVLTDTAYIRKGQIIFAQQCGACHNFRNDGIGPQLGGVTAVVSIDWIKNFVKDPKLAIESGDERAHQLYEKYKTIMPSFTSFTEEDLNSVVAFLHTKAAPDPKRRKFDPNALRNPIPEAIGMSGLTLRLEHVTTIPPSSSEGQLTRICKLDYRPDTKDLFIVDLRGKLYMLESGQPKLYLDMVFIPSSARMDYYTRHM
jgi:mono/diheme cytochrome c family protein